MNASTRLVLLGLLGACGGGYRGPTSPAAPANQPAAEETRGVLASALPYAIVDARTGRAVAEADFWAALGQARAVCAGEDHPNPHHHWAQLTIVEHLAVGDGAGRALGLEMVQTPFQGVANDYQARLVDDAAFVSRTGWTDRWGFDFALYQPMLARARDAGWSILALNAPKELTKRVSKVGVAGLDAAERAQLPELRLDDARHKAWFEAIMAEMGNHGSGDGPPPPGMPTPANLYAAQVLWDESMADGAARWLATPGTRIVILAGNGHCHDSAIVGRVQRRGVPEVVSVQPIIDDGEGNVADALLAKKNDYLFVMTMPTLPKSPVHGPAASPQ